MSYKVLIVEDEKRQQDFLIDLLKQNHPDFVVTGVAASIDEGKTLLNNTSPDLVFLDVLLPPNTSFDLLQDLDHIPFDVIFTTSFEEYAVKAFRLSAIDYLVKPFSKENLDEALEKFKQKRSSREAETHIKTLMYNLSETRADHARIALPTLTGFIFVAVKDIVRCTSDNTYTTFFTIDKKKIMVSKTLKECEHLLMDYQFFRVHNSHLINLSYITEYIKGEGGVARMADGAAIDVSRRRKDEFLKVLKRI